MKHYMRLKSAPFQLIWEGKKTIELRLFDHKRRAVSVGDEIEFANLSDDDRSIVVKVVAIHVFDSFELLYKSLPLEKCGYDSVSVKTANASDMNTYYSVEEQQNFGVVGIEFDLEERYTRTN